MNCRVVKVWLAKILAAIGLLAISFGSSAAQGASGAQLDKKWSAKLWEDNPQYVEVTIDTRSLDGFVSDVFVEIKFFAKRKKPIGQQTFQFTDDEKQFLERNKDLYVRYFLHDFSAARSASGDHIDYKHASPGKPTAQLPRMESAQAFVGGGKPPDVFQILRRFFSFVRRSIIGMKRKALVIGPIPQKKPRSFH